MCLPVAAITKMQIKTQISLSPGGRYTSSTPPPLSWKGGGGGASFVTQTLAACYKCRTQLRPSVSESWSSTVRMLTTDTLMCTHSEIQKTRANLLVAFRQEKYMRKIHLLHYDSGSINSMSIK